MLAHMLAHTRQTRSYNLVRSHGVAIALVTVLCAGAMLFPHAALGNSVSPAETNPPRDPALEASSHTATIPPRAVAPWPVLRHVDALSFTSRSPGMTTVWGSYGERSESVFDLDRSQQSQELGNAASGHHAIYANLDLGSGVDSVMLRVSLPSGTNGAEIRLGSPTGTLAGSCVINSTGGIERYQTIGCPVDPRLARGQQNLAIRFTGPNTSMRFNWFAFWARGTVQEIDRLQSPSAHSADGRPGGAQPSPTTRWQRDPRANLRCLVAVTTWRLPKVAPRHLLDTG
jgi:hypothetical protein